MKHRLRNFLAALSLALCALWVILWVRSGNVFDDAKYVAAGESSGWGCERPGVQK